MTQTSLSDGSVLTHLQAGRESENAFPGWSLQANTPGNGGTGRKVPGERWESTTLGWGVREPGSNPGFVTLIVWP